MLTPPVWLAGLIRNDNHWSKCLLTTQHGNQWSANVHVGYLPHANNCEDFQNSRYMNAWSICVLRPPTTDYRQGNRAARTITRDQVDTIGTLHFEQSASLTLTILYDTPSARYRDSHNV